MKSNLAPVGVAQYHDSEWWLMHIGKCDEFGRVIATVDGESAAQRIAACVNYCADLSMEELTSVTTARSVLDEVNDLSYQLQDANSR